MTKKLSILLSLSLVLQIVLGAFAVSASEAATKASDINGHWAEQTIQTWLDQGTINGYKDGSFKPNASISRAEFIKMMNKVFKVAEAQTAISFNDLSEQHWAYAEIAAAVEAGYVKGTSETTVSPDANITRQEAAVMLVKLLKLEGTADLNFKDADSIPAWSKKAIEALVAGEFLQGDPSGNVRAQDSLKRAEAVVLIDKVAQSLETVFDQQGEYGNKDEVTVIQGDVRIASAGVTLINTEITGDLTIDEAVGEGDVYLKKVTVQGTTLVQGGGENSIHLEDTVVVRIVVDKASGKVRIVAQGSTTVKQVAVQSPVKLEESQVTDSGFSNIELTPNLPAGSQVDLVGHFESVNVISANIEIKIPSGSINQLSVGDGASGNTIALDQAASIETLVLDVVTSLVGQGTINQAKVATAAQDSKFESAPKQVEVVEKGAATPSATPTATPAPTSDNSSDPVVTAKPTAKPTATVAPSPAATVEPTETAAPSPTATVEPTETAAPTAKPNEELSNDASIHNIVINEELTLSKLDLDRDSDLPVEGFDPTHLRYSIDLPSDKQTVDVTLQVEIDENAKLYANVYNATARNSVELEQNNNQYAFQLNTADYYSVDLYVKSESGVFSKYYDLYFVGTFDVQKTMKINQYGDNYSLESQSVRAGDLVTVTIPAEHSTTGQTEEVSSAAHYNKDGSYDYLSVGLDNLSPSSLTGKLGLKIERNGNVIYDGDYAFDFTEIEFIELPESILNINFLTKEEVNEFNNNAYRYDMLAYEYRVNINKDELLALNSSAEFVRYYLEYRDYNPSNRVFTVDSEKSFRTVYGGNLYTLNGYSGFSYSYDPIDNLDQYEVETGQQLRVMIYNAEGQLIEAFYHEFEVPEENLADNVVPKLIVSEEDLEGTPLELTSVTSSIEWKKNVNFNDSDEELVDLSFASNYNNYVAAFDQALDGQTFTLKATAAAGLEVGAWLQKKNLTTEKMEYVSYNGVNKGMSFTLDSDYSYNLQISVRNPYTSESEFYQFNLNSTKLTEQFFELTSDSLHARNVVPGDVIELTIPAAFNTLGKDFVYSFTVSEDLAYFDHFHGIEIVDFDLGLDRLYDNETKQEYRFAHNNSVGSIAIKIIRNDAVVYEGNVAFDFSQSDVEAEVPAEAGEEADAPAEVEAGADVEADAPAEVEAGADVEADVEADAPADEESADQAEASDEVAVETAA